MTFALLTAYNDKAKDYAEIGIVNKTAYCKKHNITFIVETNPITHDKLEWTKLLLIIKHLPKYSWIFWTDADSLIMNSEINFKPPTCKEDFVISYDRYTLNAGQFWIRNCPWSYDFLVRAYNQRQGNWFVDDQGAIMYLLENNFNDMEHTKVVSQRMFNSYPHNGTYKTGDFMIHFAGPYDKLSLMKEWSQKAK